MNKTVIRRRFNPSKFFRGIGLLIILTLTLTMFLKSSATGALQTNYKQVTVKRGDTIWKIARENKSNRYDIEEAIYAIRQANKLKSTDLYPGQMLNIPVNF